MTNQSFDSQAAMISSGAATPAGQNTSRRVRLPTLEQSLDRGAVTIDITKNGSSNFRQNALELQSMDRAS